MSWTSVGTIKGPKGDTGEKGDTGQGSDEEAGWKLPVDQILTTNTLPTGVSAGYRVAICTSSVMAIKEYNGSSWDTESLDPYSVIPLNIREVYKCIWQNQQGLFIWVLIMASLVSSDL